MEKTLYAELRPQEFRDRLKACPIAYLPLGTLEWHGEHLPLGADGIQSEGFFKVLAQKLGGIVMPMLFLGPDRHTSDDSADFYGMDLWGKEPKQLDGSAYWIKDEIFKELLESTLYQLKRAGFKIVVAHGHGPSTMHFQNNQKEWSEKFGLQLFNCWGSDSDKDGLGIQVDHAAMNETSLMMAIRPDLVDMKALPENLDEWPEAIGGKDPRVHASQTLGEKIIKIQADRMIKLLEKAIEQL